MFLRVVNSKKYKYIKIVENYREDGKIKQRVVANLGKLQDLSVKEAENIASKLLELVNSPKKVTSNNHIPSLEELDRENYGYIVYKKIWDRFKFDEILNDIVKNKKIEFDFKKIVFSLVIDRLLNPKSKLALFNNKDDYFNINEDLKLNHIYRSLDILANNKEKIEKYLFQQNKNLFNISTDIIFYDVTTFYYESKNENDLKKFGYSKDGKFGDVQIVMGLLIDKSGLPIGYELFSGNTFDSKTILKTLKSLKEKFNIDNIVIVADRGINSKINLKLIKEAGFDYLMAVSIKQLPNSIKDIITDKSFYRIVLKDENSEDGLYAINYFGYYNKINYYEEFENKETKKIEIKKQTITLKEMMVCSYSNKRAKKDRFDRYKALDKANSIILNNQKSSLIDTKNFKKYIQKSTNEKNNNCKDFTMGLDWLKIKEEQKYDGLYAITTSKLDLDPLEVIKNYHNLYRIEDSFRVLKSTFNTRPIYHYKENRIEAHFIICFIAFMLERDLEIRLKKSKSFKQYTITPDRIKEALNSLEVSKVKIDNKIFYLKSNHTNNNNKLKFAKDIMRFLHINQLKNLSTKEDIEEIFNF